MPGNGGHFAGELGDPELVEDIGGIEPDGIGLAGGEMDFIGGDDAGSVTPMVLTVSTKSRVTMPRGMTVQTTSTVC
jgi:hypothetical protein